MAHRGTGIAERLDTAEPTLVFEQTLATIERARRRRTRRRRLLIAGSIVLVPLLAVGTFLVTQRNVTTQVSLDEATEQFRSSHQEIGDVTKTSTEEASKDRAVNDDGPTGSTTSSSADQHAPDAVVSAPEPYALPAEGVYTYRANGGEQISVLGARHEYPEQVHATVRHLGECNWEHRNDVIAEHVDRRHWCSGPGRLSQSVQAREVEFFGQRDGSVATCAPPLDLHRSGDPTGATAIGRCTGKGVDAKITRTYVGIEDMIVGGESLETIHLRVVGTFTGRATGTSHEELWVTPDTGMTVRWDRAVDTNADSVFGKVHYTENASFVLTSLVPQT